MQPESSIQTVVLVADDEPAVLSVIERVLLRFGYTVLTAVNGVQALQVAETHPGPIDILLTELEMPELDGVSLAKNLRNVRTDVRVVIMSAHFDRSLKEHKCWATLSKPFTVSALLDKVSGKPAQ